MKIGVLGSGDVGKVLSQGFLKNGYTVMRGSRDPGKLTEWKNQAGTLASTGTFEETAQFGEIVILAVKGTAAESVAKSCAAFLKGKTVFDTTNPIADLPPIDGVLKYFTTLDESLMEKLQKTVPEANFVKVFNSVGNALMVNPELKGGRPSMFICGNSNLAKMKAAEILRQFGWETEDTGNDWNHAFKVLKV